MKRYDVYGEGNEHEIDLTVEENSLGAWVKYEDAQAMKEALEAIVARIDGVFDHPSLLKQGPLSIGHNDDVRKIAKQALTLANGGQP